MELSNPNRKLCVSNRVESFTKVYDLNVGDVFQVVGDYEAVMFNIEKYTPPTLIFEVFPITPGTSLFTMYGPDHCVVTKKQKR